MLIKTLWCFLQAPMYIILTVGTKIIADPEKCFQELISEKLLIFIAGDNPSFSDPGNDSPTTVGCK